MLDAGEWKAGLRGGLDEIMDQAVRAGARSGEVFDAIAQALHAMRDEWARDPERAQGPEAEIVEEPTNDWPAAEV